MSIPPHRAHLHGSATVCTLRELLSCEVGHRGVVRVGGSKAQASGGGEMPCPVHCRLDPCAAQADHCGKCYQAGKKEASLMDAHYS